MSSVLRFIKQAPSNTLFAAESSPLWLGSTIEAAADGSGAVFTAPSVITFPTLLALQGALNALSAASDATVSGLVAVKDMGKRIFMGVEGEDSEMVVFSLVQIIQGGDLDFVGYVCVKDVTDTLEVDVGRGAW
jgi:hypothetical protein